MKRFLAVLISAVMLMSLIPTAFAATETNLVASQVYDYVLTYDALTEAAKTAFSSAISDKDAAFISYRDLPYYEYYTAQNVLTNKVRAKFPSKTTKYVESETAGLKYDSEGTAPLVAGTYNSVLNLVNTAPYELSGRAYETCGHYRLEKDFNVFRMTFILGSNTDPDSVIGATAGYRTRPYFAMKIKLPEGAEAGKYTLDLYNAEKGSISDIYSDPYAAVTKVYLTEIGNEGLEWTYVWSNSQAMSADEADGDDIEYSDFISKYTSAENYLGIYKGTRGASYSYDTVLELEPDKEYLLYAQLDLNSIDVDALNATANADNPGEIPANTYLYNKKFYQNFRISGAKLTHMVEAPVTEETITDTKVSVYIVSEDENKGTVATNLANEVDEIEIGDSVTATATPAEGYTFAYWKNRAGTVLSTSARETFKLNTNTAIYAVFEEVVAEDATDIPVYFYNGNGEPITKKTAVKGETTFGTLKNGVEAYLTGYDFKHWSDVDENTAISDEKVIGEPLRAVAIFEDTGDEYTVKNGEAVVTSTAKYGEEVTVTGGESFSYWKLGDKIISYDKSFKFNVYGDITLTEVTGESVTPAPTIVLDKIGDNYFITYDANGYTLLEAGILFAKSGKPLVGSCNSKAIAKKGTGQFTAKPSIENESIARGYMMYKDGEGTIKVVYAD